MKVWLEQNINEPELMMRNVKGIWDYGLLSDYRGLENTPYEEDIEYNRLTFELPNMTVQFLIQIYANAYGQMYAGIAIDDQLIDMKGGDLIIEMDMMDRDLTAIIKRIEPQLEQIKETGELGNE